MNVRYKLSYADGLEPVSILIIPPAGVSPFYVEDTTQTALQALAPEGQPWGDEESRTIAQQLLDASPQAALYGGCTIVIPDPEEE